MVFEVNGNKSEEDAPAVAIVFLQSSGDTRNKISLTDDALVVVKGGRQQVFVREDVRTLAFHKRLLLLPLVAGGVLLPFGVVAMFGGFLNPYFVVLLVLAGMYLLYEGLNSRWVLTISCKGTSTDVPLESPTQNVRAFVEFVNAQLRGPSGSGNAHIYAVISDEQYRASEGERFINAGTSPVRAYTAVQWTRKRDEVSRGQCVLRLDPTHDLLRIEYARDEHDDVLYPYILGPIPRKAIVQRLPVVPGKC